MSINAFSDYLALEKKYSKHTILAYIRDLEMLQEYIKDTNEAVPISKISYSEIRQWIVELVNSGVSNRTINRKVSSLNTYYKFLQKIQEIENNPLKHHKAL
ncbi:MAG: site-specific integrase, partial [Kangiellaceae bacterium]|nr:site-specific integrase [Kangiellaceae bacterium]